MVAIAAAISPYREVRDEVRKDIGRFVEVYVECPLDTLVERDVKGLYKKALAGEIANFTGVSDPYEAPLNPEVTLDTDRETPQRARPGCSPGLSRTASSLRSSRMRPPYSAQEQEAVQRRLKSLGYVE